MSATSLIARKEAGELLLSLRGFAWFMAVAVALSVFGLLLVSNTELSLLDNAQVVYDMGGIVTALGGLLALVVGLDAVAGERERGSLVPLLLTPASRDAILAGKLGGVAIAWGVMYALSMPYLWAVGSTGQNLWQGMSGAGPAGLAGGAGLRFLRHGSRRPARLGPHRASHRPDRARRCPPVRFCSARACGSRRSGAPSMPSIPFPRR